MIAEAFTNLIIAEIHRAIAFLGATAQPSTPAEARRAVRALRADVDLCSIIDSWQETLDDEQILELLCDWNAGRPVFAQVYAVSEARMRYPGVGGHDAHACTCTSACPVTCDGDRCGCEACARAWIDSRLRSGARHDAMARG